MHNDKKSLTKMKCTPKVRNIGGAFFMAIKGTNIKIILHSKYFTRVISEILKLSPQRIWVYRRKGKKR